MNKMIFLLACIASNVHAYTQKKIKIDDSLALHATEWAPVLQKDQKTIQLTAYGFSDYKVTELKNGWEKSSYWSLRLAEKNISRASTYVRTGFSFRFQNNSDTADVVVLFQKSLPKGLVIISDNEVTSGFEGLPSFTALIRIHKDSLPWQLFLQLDAKAAWKASTKGFLTNGKEKIELVQVNHWSNGKKPAITGVLGAGTALYKDGQAVAAVQYPGLVQPAVWLSQQLQGVEPFIVAAVIETLLIAATDTTDDGQQNHQ